MQPLPGRLLGGTRVQRYLPYYPALLHTILPTRYATFAYRLPRAVYAHRPRTRRPRDINRIYRVTPSAFRVVSPTRISCGEQTCVVFFLPHTRAATATCPVHVWLISAAYLLPWPPSCRPYSGIQGPSPFRIAALCLDISLCCERKSVAGLPVYPCAGRPDETPVRGTPHIPTGHRLLPAPPLLLACLPRAAAHYDLLPHTALPIPCPRCYLTGGMLLPATAPGSRRCYRRGLFSCVACSL